MTVLGIDTATRTASVALVCEDRVLGETSLDSAGGLGATILPLVDEVLTAAARGVDDIDLVAVSIGPGSFTGLRVGLSVAKGLSLASGCPVVGVSTLEALALVAGERGCPVCPVLDARKGEVYAALFVNPDGVLTRIMEDRAMTPTELAKALAGGCVLIGDGVEAYSKTWQECLGERAEMLPFAEYHPRGAVIAGLGRRQLATLGAESVASMVPRYCRRPEAEVNLAAH